MCKLLIVALLALPLTASAAVLVESTAFNVKGVDRVNMLVQLQGGVFGTDTYNVPFCPNLSNQSDLLDTLADAQTNADTVKIGYRAESGNVLCLLSAIVIK